MINKKSFYYRSDGKILHDGKEIDFSLEWENGATIGAGWDLERDKIFFSYKGDNKFVNEAFSATQLGGIKRLIPSVAVQGNKKVKESNPITCRIVEDLWPNDNQKNDDCKFFNTRLFRSD